VTPSHPSPDPATRVSWTPRAAVRRAVEVLREAGPGLLARKVLAELFYQRLIVYEARLDAPRRPIRSELPVRFEVLGTDRVADYLACLPGANPEQIERRMSTGDRCHAARLYGEVVAVRWVAFRDVQLTRLGVVLPVAEGDAYLYGAYTAPRWRRHGIAAALTADILNRLQADGYRRALSARIPENTAARSLNPSRGRPVAVLGVVGVGPWRRQLRPRPLMATGQCLHREAGSWRPLRW
jgi:ribosomal protein S18 acetylase RimI-like enzyme